MKLLSYLDTNGRSRIGRLASDTTVQPLSFPSGEPITSLIALIECGISSNLLVGNDNPLSLASIQLQAPIPKPARNIFCVGKNYINHAQEFTNSGYDAGQTAKDAVPNVPIIFSKPPETVIAHGQRIWDAEGVSDSLDYEAELAVIIGTGGRGISKADAMNHVWGYTIINDITARDWQRRHKQWHLGKSFDTFCPMGPVAVTADELDAGSLPIKCWVNNELRQDANTSDLIFDIPTLIETLSAGITLKPGDIIATGTPQGVGIGFNPPKFLKRGDIVTIEIAGIGKLENEVGS